jgi:Ku protein
VENTKVRRASPGYRPARSSTCRAARSHEVAGWRARDEFVPRKEIDELYNIRPYYIAPDGKVGQDAFVVIRQVIEEMNMVAVARIVLTSRQHIIALEPRGKGIMAMLLRFPYEVRDEKDYFDDIRDIKLGKDAMDQAHRANESWALPSREIRGPL